MRRRREEPLSWEDATSLIRAIMRIEGALEEMRAILLDIRSLLEGEDGEEEEEADGRGN